MADRHCGFASLPFQTRSSRREGRYSRTMGVKVQRIAPEDYKFIEGPFTTTIRHTSPAFWSTALRLSLQRFTDGQAELLRQRRAPLKYAPDRGIAVAYQESADCHFILIAMRNVLRVMEDRMDASTDSRLRRLEEEFRKEHPDAWHLRDVLEHLLDYEAGNGRLQRQGEVPKEESQPWLHYEAADPSAEVTLYFAGSGRRCCLEAAAKKAMEIADLLTEIEHDELAENPSGN
jgi:hypothetical protein